MRLQRAFHRALRDLQRLKAGHPQPDSRSPQAEPPLPEPVPPPIPEAIPVPPEVVHHQHTNSPKQTHFDPVSRGDSLQPVRMHPPIPALSSEDHPSPEGS
jgi:hypothetical protein